MMEVITYYGSFVGSRKRGAGESGEGRDDMGIDLPEVIFNNEIGSFEEVRGKCGGREGKEGKEGKEKNGILSWKKIGFDEVGMFKVDTSVYSGSRDIAMRVYSLHGGDEEDDKDDDKGDEIDKDEDDDNGINGAADATQDDEWDDWESFVETAAAIEAIVPEEAIILPVLAVGASEELFGEDLYE